MNVIEIELNKIKPYSKNPRKNDRAVDGVAESIKQFGFKQPLVIDKNNVIICGHTRYKAAQKLGLSTVPCVRADELTKEQAKAYRIADNKLNELAMWDLELLGDELATFEFDFTPFQFDLPTYTYDFDVSDKNDEQEPNDLSARKERAFKSGGASEMRYGVYVEVEDEDAQRALYDRLVADGYSVRTTTI